jgi:hypothetical protein
MKGGEIGLPTCVHCHVANSRVHVDEEAMVTRVSLQAMSSKTARR